MIRSANIDVANTVERERELMTRALGGDTEAYGDLFELCQPKIFRMAYGILHDNAAAEDAVQETFSKDWTASPPIGAIPRQGHGSPRSRSTSAAIGSEKENTWSRGSPTGSPRGAVGSSGPSTRAAASRAVQHEDHRLLAIAMGFLTEAQREVFILHYDQGLSVRRDRRDPGPEGGSGPRAHTGRRRTSVKNWARRSGSPSTRRPRPGLLYFSHNKSSRWGSRYPLGYRSRKGGNVSPARPSGLGSRGHNMNVSEFLILMVEDEPDQVLFTQRALEKANLVNPLRIVSNGQEAIAYLSGKEPYADRKTNALPSLILLDLKLPRIGGLEVLAVDPVAAEAQRHPRRRPHLVDQPQGPRARRPARRQLLPVQAGRLRGAPRDDEVDRDVLDDPPQESRTVAGTGAGPKDLAASACSSSTPTAISRRRLPKDCGAARPPFGRRGRNGRGRSRAPRGQQLRRGPGRSRGRKRPVRAPGPHLGRPTGHPPVPPRPGSGTAPRAAGPRGRHPAGLREEGSPQAVSR